MPFYPSHLAPPKKLLTSKFQLLPLSPAHLQLDYAAVMAGREMLNLWSGSTWPTLDFTLAENLADLQWHEREHEMGIAFTYTILNPAATACLGCLYIRPLSELRLNNPTLPVDIASHDALARFWLLPAPQDPGLEQDLLETLIDWFQEIWQFPQIYFHTPQANRQQVQLFNNSSLTRRFELQLPQRGGLHIFWS